MNKFLFLCAMALIALGANAQRVIGEKDWTGGYTGNFPLWFDSGNCPEATIASDADGIAITNPSLQEDCYSPQVVILGELFYSANHNYIVRLTLKVPSDGTYVVHFGNFYQIARIIEVPVKASDNFQEIDVDCSDWDAEIEGDGHVQLCVGWVSGTTVIKKIQVIDKDAEPTDEDEEGGILISQDNFPDANFRAYVSSEVIDMDENGYLTDEEIAGVTSMKIYARGIGDLTGINYFTALETLNCGNNQLTTLDVSGCTALKELWCNNNNNRLTTLNVSGCTALKGIDCSNNQLTTLDVSGCTALEGLSCDNNQLTTLNVSGCTALKRIDCSNNQLTTLDVSGFTTLKNLYCRENQLTTLNVSGCTALENLYCHDNQLTTLDVSGCTALGSIECYNNPLTTLDVSGCIALGFIDCHDNQLTTLNVSGCTALKNLQCVRNQLTTLNVSGCTALKNLQCVSNQLTTLNVSGCTALEYLSCYGNKLTTLDVSGCIALGFIDCHDNQLTTLGVSGCTALKYLGCYGNKLTTLDVSGCIALGFIDCHDNQLTTLDVSGFTTLKTLSCYNNHLRGEGLNDFVNSLPDVTTGELRVYVIDSPYNKMTPEQVAAAKANHWKVLMNNGTSWVDFEGIVDGDANGDTKVNAADIVVIINYMNGITVEGFDANAADVNCDSSVDDDDIELIKKIIMGN